MNEIAHSKPSIGNEEIRKAGEVLASGHLARGRETAAFEREMAHFLGLRQGIAVSSGTAALFLALKALGIKGNDEVLIPSFVCTAVFNAVTLAGAKPVLVDCAPGDYAMSPPDNLKKRTRRTKAIIVPHLFGQPADMKALCSTGIPVIEDCAQTLGANVQGRPAGAWGEIAVCSFFATKLLATGEGGMVLSRSSRYIERIRDIIDYDKKGDLAFRFNFKMTDMQAAIGRVQLKKLPSFVRRRRAIADLYTRALAGKSLRLPGPIDEREHIYFRYVIGEVKAPVKALRLLRGHGISAALPLFKPLHRYGGLSGFTETERAWKHSISIPLYPSLTEKEIIAVKKALSAIL